MSKERSPTRDQLYSSSPNSTRRQFIPFLGISIPADWPYPKSKNDIKRILKRLKPRSNSGSTSPTDKKKKESRERSKASRKANKKRKSRG